MKIRYTTSWELFVLSGISLLHHIFFSPVNDELNCTFCLIRNCTLRSQTPESISSTESVLTPPQLSRCRHPRWDAFDRQEQYSHCYWRYLSSQCRVSILYLVTCSSVCIRVHCSWRRQASALDYAVPCGVLKHLLWISLYCQAFSSVYIPASTPGFEMGIETLCNTYSC